MSTKEIDRAEVFSRLRSKLLKQTEAAQILGLKPRQIRRLYREYKKSGAIALVSKKRGQRSNHQLPAGIKELVLALIQEKYPDFGPTLAHEKLREVHSIKISIWTVRQLMITGQLWREKKIKKKRIFQMRERRTKEGELEQIDGSPHDWFEGRGPKCSLLHCIDDATGKIQAAHFATGETVWAYFDLAQIYLKNHGRPLCFYSDKHAVFRINRAALRGEGVTQFGRALKELGIEAIFANTPQAKGRIERSNRTLQDRLVKELRLQQISTIEEANAYLPIFIEEYNRKFAVISKDPHNAHRPLLQEHDLNRIFTLKEERHLSKNLTFQYKNTLYQIQTDRESYALRKSRIEVREKKDGTIEVLYKNKPLAIKAYYEQEKQGEIIDSKTLNEIIDKLQTQAEPRPRYRPPYNHPWKRGTRLSYR